MVLCMTRVIGIKDAILHSCLPNHSYLKFSKSQKQFMSLFHLLYTEIFFTEAYRNFCNRVHFIIEISVRLTTEHKDWAGKKVTILNSTILMDTSSEIISAFNKHFT